MSDKIDLLKNAGCDMDQAVERMLGDKEFLMELIVQVLDDPGFELLGEHLKEKNIGAAFDDAHSLKGITANTGLTPLFELVVKLVEPLRAGTSEGLDVYYEELLAKRQEMKDFIA